MSFSCFEVRSERLRTPLPLSRALITPDTCALQASKSFYLLLHIDEYDKTIPRIGILGFGLKVAGTFGIAPGCWPPVLYKAQLEAPVTVQDV